MNYKWSWCWDCDCATIDVNDKSNLCCARWEWKPEECQRVLEWIKTNPEPESPTPEDIDAALDWKKYSKEELEISRIFDALGKSSYWLPKKWADTLQHTIPSYEELCAGVGIEPVYDLKTGAQWAKDEEKEVFGKDGWPEDSFENEEIPWREFCNRRRRSEIEHKRRLKQN